MDAGWAGSAPGAPARGSSSQGTSVENAQIADVFEELADLLEFRGENPFRVRAYRNGAHAIRDLDESVAAILADPGRDLAEIPGIGDTLAEKARDLVTSGRLAQLDELRQE